MRRRLTERTTSYAALGRVRDLLRAEPASLLADDPTTGGPASGLRVTLTFEVAGGTSASQVVEVSLGTTEATTDGVRLPLTWRPLAHARVLPTFDGAVLARPAPSGTVLELDGEYVPPLGPVGAFGDGVVGHRVARACAANLLARVDDRITRAASRTSDQIAFRPAPYAPDLRPSAEDAHGAATPTTA